MLRIIKGINKIRELGKLMRSDSRDEDTTRNQLRSASRRHNPSYSVHEIESGLRSAMLDRKGDSLYDTDWY